MVCIQKMGEKMNKRELAKIKKAARNCKDKNQKFYIAGKSFSCRWTGSNFEWIAPSGEKYNLTHKEVLNYIGDGSYIETVILE